MSTETKKYDIYDVIEGPDGLEEIPAHMGIDLTKKEANIVRKFWGNSNIYLAGTKEHVKI